MQQSETELELFSGSGTSPSEDRRVSMLFDTNANGTYLDSSIPRKNGDTLHSSKSKSKQSTPNGKNHRQQNQPRRRSMQQGVPKWERRAIRVSIHFFYVSAIGILFCMVIYLIILNRSIYAALRSGGGGAGAVSSGQFVSPDVAALVAEANQSALQRLATENVSGLTSATARSTASLQTIRNGTNDKTTATGAKINDLSSQLTHTTMTISANRSNTTVIITTSAAATTSDTRRRSRCEISGIDKSAKVYITQISLWLFVGPIANQSEAVQFCASLDPATRAIRLLQFSESNKFENTRDDVDRFIEQTGQPVWVSAVVTDYYWYWVNGGEKIRFTDLEFAVDDTTDNTDCAVLRKQDSDLRIENALCGDTALVVCECSDGV